MRKLLTVWLCLLACLPLAAQDSLLLWPNGIPGGIPSAETTVYQGNRVSLVQQPDITVYLPPKEKANGTAVVICPGGGYSILAIGHEGHNIAWWLNQHGIAGIVLKYRLPSDKIMQDKTIGPLMDAQQAIRMVRLNARAWNIDPAKVGIMGFSAGGHLASTALTHTHLPAGGLQPGENIRPDFGILIYPVVSFQDEIMHQGSRRNLIGEHPARALKDAYSNELRVNSQTPPTFLVHSSDDKVVVVENSIRFYQALQKQGTPVEMHIYQSGGHGYGMGKPGTAEASWPDRCLDWLKVIGMR
jgi:acetyl esterase/lipase